MIPRMDETEIKELKEIVKVFMLFGLAKSIDMKIVYKNRTRIFSSEEHFEHFVDCIEVFRYLANFYKPKTKR